MSEKLGNIAMDRKNNNFILYILMAVLALIWGLSFIFTKYALEEVSTFELLAVRWPIAGILYLILGKTKAIKLDFKDKPKKPLIILCICQPCLYAIFETIGIGIATTTESSVLIATSPLMVIILSRLVFKTKSGKNAVIGIIIAFIGVILCTVFSPNFSLGGKMMGYLSLIAAVTCGSTYAILTSRNGKYYTALEMAYAMAISGGVWFFLISLIMGNGLHPYKVLLSGGTATWSLLFLGVLCSFFAYLIFNTTLVKLPTEIAACINTNSINVVGVVSGILIFHDACGWYTLVGLALMIIGIVITNVKNKE